jgi:hypothetical protein
LSVGGGIAVKVGNWMIQIDPTVEQEICRIWEMVYFTYSVAFVSHIWVAQKLHHEGVFAKIAITSKQDDMDSERLMGAVSHWFVGSDPEVCNLDGDFEVTNPAYVDKISHGKLDHYEGVDKNMIDKLCDESMRRGLEKVREAFNSPSPQTHNRSR